MRHDAGMAATATAAPVPWLVGREQEHDVLDCALHAAAMGRPSLLVVHSEAGGGTPWPVRSSVDTAARAASDASWTLAHPPARLGVDTGTAITCGVAGTQEAPVRHAEQSRPASDPAHPSTPSPPDQC